jgi:hypothetical protein
LDHRIAWEAATQKHVREYQELLNQAKNLSFATRCGTTTVLVVGPPIAGDPLREHVPDPLREPIIAMAVGHPVMPMCDCRDVVVLP